MSAFIGSYFPDDHYNRSYSNVSTPFTLRSLTGVVLVPRYRLPVYMIYAGAL